MSVPGGANFTFTAKVSPPRAVNLTLGRRWWIDQDHLARRHRRLVRPGTRQGRDGELLGDLRWG